MHVEEIIIDDLADSEIIGGISAETSNKEISIQKDHYNPTVLKSSDGHEIIAVREESREIETDSRIEFYARVDGNL